MSSFRSIVPFFFCIQSVQPYYYHPEEHEESDEDVSDEDSNDENHVGNEYPDTEEDEEE